MADAALQTPPAAKPAVVYKPRPPAGLAKALVIALYVSVAVDTLNVMADTLHLRFIGDDTSPAEVVYGLCGLLQTLVFLVAGFLSLKWVYRMSLNAHALAPDMKITPAWGVGWFFVPVASLFKPYQGVRESWQVSAAAGVGWQTQPVPLLLRWWWLVWIIANILGNISFRLQMDSSLGGQGLPAALFTLAQDVLNLPADVLFIFVVQRLTAMQVAALSTRVFE